MKKGVIALLLVVAVIGTLTGCTLDISAGGNSLKPISVDTPAPEQANK